VVFQNYALFPHLRVRDNVAFPHKQRKLRKNEISQKVGAILDTVGLAHLATRYPRELSGGQQQRVALARALVFDPQLLLLDEPLGALDKRLREGLQLEIKRIHEEVGVTFIFVTHDQEEALVMSDRIAVFNEGGLEHVATAHELYENPRTLFAAQFLGNSNVMQGSLVKQGDGMSLDGDGFSLRAPATRAAVGDRAALVIRPERLRVLPAGHAVPAEVNALSGTVSDVIYLGGRQRLLLDVQGQEFMADEMAPQFQHRPGDSVVVTWDPATTSLVDPGPAGATPRHAADEVGVPA
jgi:putative spermidine/putrescine transport system ATP-binding protein